MSRDVSQESLCLSLGQHSLGSCSWAANTSIIAKFCSRRRHPRPAICPHRHARCPRSVSAATFIISQGSVTLTHTLAPRLLWLSSALVTLIFIKFGKLHQNIKYFLILKMMFIFGLQSKRYHIDVVYYKYKLINSSLTALGVRMPKSVNNRVNKDGGV